MPPATRYQANVISNEFEALQCRVVADFGIARRWSDGVQQFPSTRCNGDGADGEIGSVVEVTPTGQQKPVVLVVVRQAFSAGCLPHC